MTIINEIKQDLDYALAYAGLPTDNISTSANYISSSFTLKDHIAPMSISISLEKNKSIVYTIESPIHPGDTGLSRVQTGIQINNIIKYLSRNNQIHKNWSIRYTPFGFYNLYLTFTHIYENRLDLSSLIYNPTEECELILRHYTSYILRL